MARKTRQRKMAAMYRALKKMPARTRKSYKRKHEKIISPRRYANGRTKPGFEHETNLEIRTKIKKSNYRYEIVLIPTSLGNPWELNGMDNVDHRYKINQKYVKNGWRGKASTHRVYLNDSDDLMIFVLSNKEAIFKIYELTPPTV